MSRFNAAITFGKCDEYGTCTCHCHRDKQGQPISEVAWCRPAPTPKPKALLDRERFVADINKIRQQRNLTWARLATITQARCATADGRRALTQQDCAKLAKWAGLDLAQYKVAR